MILNAEVESVLGRAGGCSFCGGGEAINRDGLEQLPTADLDKEPRWERRVLGVGVSGDEGGVEGVEQEISSVASVFMFSCPLVARWRPHQGLTLGFP